jgi:hypothetical protein
MFPSVFCAIYVDVRCTSRCTSFCGCVLSYWCRQFIVILNTNDSVLKGDERSGTTITLSVSAEVNIERQQDDIDYDSRIDRNLHGNLDISADCTTNIHSHTIPFGNDRDYCDSQLHRRDISEARCLNDRWIQSAEASRARPIPSSVCPPQRTTFLTSKRRFRNCPLSTKTVPRQVESLPTISSTDSP